MSKTILVTGAAGMIGSQLCNYLYKIDPNLNIVGIDDLSGGYKENLNSNIALYESDLTNLEYLDDIFAVEKPSIVYHAGAYAAECMSPFIRRYNYMNNMVASANVITSCIKHDVEQLIFFSSMSVYGKIYAPPFHEDLEPKPADSYAIAKYATELDLKVAKEQHGLNYTIIRPHNCYGPAQNIFDKFRNVIGRWMYQILNDQPITIYGDGTQKRAFSYIDDMLPCLLLATNSNCYGETINLGGTKEYSINEVAALLCEITDYSRPPVYLEPRFETKYAWSSWEKSEKLLGYLDMTSLEEGIYNMWNWAQTVYNQREPKMFNQPKELEKGLYEYWR